MKKEAATLRKALRDYAISQANAAKLHDKLKELNVGKFPAGVKPVALPYDSVQYHEQLCLKVEVKFELTERMTAEEAKRKLYGEYLLQSFRMDALVEEGRQVKLRSCASLEHFARALPRSRHT